MGTTRYDDFTRPMDPQLAVDKINAAFGGVDPHDHTGEGRGGTISGSAISGAVAEATHATNADTANNGVPAGAIMAFAMSTPPAGWLGCNGQAVSRTTYAALFSAIGTTFGAGDGSTTFNLPDLRGEFIRGWDNGRGVDSNRTFGSLQSDAFQGHEHLQYYGTNGMGAEVWSNGTNAPISTTGIVEKAGCGIPRYAAETRPRNVALMYCIKY